MTLSRAIWRAVAVLLVGLNAWQHDLVWLVIAAAGFGCFLVADLMGDDVR